MLFRAFIFFLLIAINLHAQNGDKKDSPGESQVDRVPPEKIPPAPVLSPDDAIKSFKLQPGFRVEVVAAEPLVHDPVQIAFDADSRIWVVEMSGYMRDYNGTGERQPFGKIAVLEDTDEDGKMDKRTVFLDGLTMPRAVSLVRDGVLIAEPPNLWFCRDTNADLKCDEKTLVLKDYGDTASPEHTANGLVWAIDNWIYSADWTTRLKSLPNHEWRRELTSFRGQWGISQDDYGRLVYNSNSDQFRVDLIPSYYLQRNPNYRTPTGLNVDPIGNQSTYPARVTPGVNRGYREGTLRPDGTLAKFTAACAPLIYRGENFPAEFYGNGFVCEPSANLIKRNILIETNAALRGWQAYTNAEFLASTDERFRPVNLNNGPDGAMYVVDMYRGVLQHKIFLTSYLRRQSESRDLARPIELGRIYRIVHEGKKLSATPKLSKMSSLELVGQLSSANGWVRDTAQRLLVERNDSNVADPLRKLALAGTNELGRVHALWTLDGMKAADQKTLISCIEQSGSKKLRALAIRLSEDYFKSEDVNDSVFAIMPMQSDSSADVLLQLALSFGEINADHTENVMVLLARRNSDNIYIRDALLSGLHGRELRILEKILNNERWVPLQNNNDTFLSGLAQCIVTEAKAENVNRLLELAAAAKPEQRVALLKGLATAVPVASKGRKVIIKPVRFTEEPAGLKKIKGAKDPASVALLKQIAPLLTWPGLPNYVPPKIATPLTADEQKRFDIGKQLFATTCAACHQLTGLGMEGLAPPLLDSEWVLGPDRRLSRIVLKGVKGPISVKGRTYQLEMPAVPFDDDQIASVLTYIRREWEHTADPVSPAIVKAEREKSVDRNEAWTEAELLKVK